MFDRIKRLYENGKLDMKGMINAVAKGMITENQFFLITGIQYKEAAGELPEPTEDNADEQ